MRKITIAIDMDGVAYPFDEVFCKLYKLHGGAEFVFDRWISFDNDLDPIIVSRVWKDARLFKIGEPYSGVKQALESLSKDPDFRFYLVTSVGRRPHLTVPAKWAWLQKWFPEEVGWKNFVVLRDKWLFAADVIIDDFSQNVIAWKKHREGRAFLVRRPWNQDLTDEKATELGIDVVDSLTQAVSQIRRIPWTTRGVKDG